MPDPRTTEHPPTAACIADHCHWHDVDEPSAGAHRVCFECGHAFMTAGELLAAHNATAAALARMSERFPPRWEYTPETDVEQVHSCPCCTHSW